MCCSVAVAISHWLLGPANAQILGLSGVVFAMMMLNGGLSRNEMWRTHTHDSYGFSMSGCYGSMLLF